MGVERASALPSVYELDTWVVGRLLPKCTRSGQEAC